MICNIKLWKLAIVCLKLLIKNIKQCKEKKKKLIKMTTEKEKYIENKLKIKCIFNVKIF